MDWTIFLLDLAPLLVFVVIDSFSNTRYAAVGAVAAAGLEIGYSLYAFGEIDAFSYVATALILLFGGLSFKFDNPVYFKFKPVAIGLVLATFCLVSYAMGKPVLVIAVERYSQAIPPQFLPQLRDPYVLAVLHRVSFYMGFGLIAQAALVGWAALRLSSWWWLVIRSVGFYLMLTVVVLISQ